jgi:hypothetical protein
VRIHDCGFVNMQSVLQVSKACSSMAKHSHSVAANRWVRQIEAMW